MAARLFQTTIPGLKRKAVIFAVEDRLQRVRNCSTTPYLLEALEDPTLQKTVRDAIHRRLRQLGHGDA